MFERFSRQARDAVVLAIEEASRRGDRRVGTDHLLIGVLHAPAVAESVGADAAVARRAADGLDRAALAEIGIDVGAFGTLMPAAGAPRLPLTPGAKDALKRAVRLVVAGKERRIEPAHLLAALRERDLPDPAAQLLQKMSEGRSSVVGISEPHSEPQ